MKTIGVILCGGQSRRMGQDKNQLLWRGRTLLQHVVSALEPVCDPLLLVKSQATQSLPTLESSRRLLTICDEFPAAGPLASFYSALRFLSGAEVPPAGSDSHRSWWSGNDQPADFKLFLAASDMPQLQTDVVVGLLHALADYQAAVPVVQQSPQPLCAAYHSSCLPVVADQWQRGQRSLRGLLTALRVCWLDADWLRRLDPDLISLHNCNTPEDWQRLGSNDPNDSPNKA